MLIPFHEVYAVRTQGGHAAGLSQLSYVVFISQARNPATGALGHVHWLLYTEYPAGVSGKYRDGKLAHIKRSQTFTKEQRYKQDQVINIVRSDPLKINAVSEVCLKVPGELMDAFDGTSVWCASLSSGHTCVKYMSETLFVCPRREPAYALPRAAG